MAFFSPLPPGVRDVFEIFRYNQGEGNYLYKLANWENIKCGEKVFIGDYVLINGGEECNIGDFTSIHAYASIIGGGRCIIGKRCAIGYHTMIVNGTDTYAKKNILDYTPPGQKPRKIKPFLMPPREGEKEEEEEPEEKGKEGETKGLSMSSAMPESERAVKRGTIIIEDDVYIGPHCVVTLPQIGPNTLTIGHGCIIGAFSFIDKSVGPNLVVHPEQKLIYKNRF
jgi:acetyltransferase-like isoleucine patch superfamily enzyme